MSANPTVAVMGLGYVGLPLALAFGRKRPTLGFDLSQSKVEAYRNGQDPTNEVPPSGFKEANQITFTTDPSQLAQAKVIIVAVPTPVDEAHRPDLTPLKGACEILGPHLQKGATVVFESTVYPGVTEDYCGPILAQACGHKEFRLGYSPERINPGDKEHTLEKITKVVAGQDQDTLQEVASLYEEVIEAGVFRAQSIKVAEAAKVIENTQRDLNIALMNELALIFNRLDIDTAHVLEAAGTKWNFLRFTPGLVGGHCIGVDPYYLTHCAELSGYHPQVILAGRRINDNMGKFVAEQTIKQLISQDCPIKGSRVLVMGLTFKENCGDLRNSRVIDVIQELKSYGIEPLVWDPVAEAEEAQREYGVTLHNFESLPKVEAIIATVPHKEILDKPMDALRSITSQGAPFMDVKSAFDQTALTEKGFRVWRL